MYSKRIVSRIGYSARRLVTALCAERAFAEMRTEAVAVGVREGAVEVGGAIATGSRRRAIAKREQRLPPDLSSGVSLRGAVTRRVTWS